MNAVINIANDPYPANITSFARLQRKTPILNENKVGAAVMLSGVVNIPRIKNLQRVAIEAQENMADIRSQSEEKLRELIEEGTDELEPLF